MSKQQESKHTPEYIPMRYTIKCVVDGCGELASYYSGHVITEFGEHILAGCCKTHSEEGRHPIGDMYCDFMGIQWRDGYVADLHSELSALREELRAVKDDYNRCQKDFDELARLSDGHITNLNIEHQLNRELVEALKKYRPYVMAEEDETLENSIIPLIDSLISKSEGATNSK